MLTPAYILRLTEKYLTQQAELYSGRFYLESRPGRAEHLQPSVDQTEELEAFRRQIVDCQKCALAGNRTNFVFGTGNPQAELMCIGEAPGFEEDRQGEPFVGPAGELLDKILKAIGFAREDVYITNIVKCRPPNNRNPEHAEVAECMPYLKRQIELIDPRLILALGRVAAHSLLNLDLPIAKMRGQTFNYDHRQVIVTYHPAALLRNTDLKRPTWEDVQRLRALYDQKMAVRS